MIRQQSCHKLVYKLHSSLLKQSKWNLTLPFSLAMDRKNDVVALHDSQILRWICELNGTEDIDRKAADLKKEIKDLKKQPKTPESREKIQALYEKLYTLQYQKDYFCMIMDSNKDYDRANLGFQINGYPYHRLLGTNGGIKKSTITYIGDNVYAEIVKRMDNGRDKSKTIIPAKLEAYQALICSGSIPVTMPRILIVKDCHVTFRENVIQIHDACGEEPQLTYENDYEIQYCDSDGYGLMSPDYSRRICRDLYGGMARGQTISGVNTRYAWTKGMLFTFDFVAFAQKVNHGDYTVCDAWGVRRDVRNFDVILTTSMVKLWDSYQSLEHFIGCCNENHYQFSVAKATPQTLENARNANYQFLQTYQLSEEELRALCQPTIDEIRDVLGGDWRKAIVFAKGMYLHEDSIDSIGQDFIKALMVEPRLMQDPFIQKKLHSMIQKRIEMAAKGSIKMSGNFAIVSGDMYALAQSVFGLPVTGLLKPGEVYHKYWIDKNVEDIVLFRAPMTCHNNIRKRKVVRNDEMDFWYRYNTTGIILNAWDSTCDATNGSDKDGDMFFTTDNKILVAHTRNSTTIECVQKKAEKTIPTQKDLIQANKLAFGDEIGSITNHITAMLERQAAFHEDSEEYRVLDYRIKCGQHFQQCAIDRAKGILSNPMPKYWYSKAACQKLPEDTPKQRQFKDLCMKIVAENKPYFMKYVYPDLMAKYNRYIKDTNSKCIREFQMPMAKLLAKPDKNDREQEFADYYQKLMPVGNNPCIINRIAWLFESAFPSCPKQSVKAAKFDSSLLKSGCAYKKADYQQIAKQKSEYDQAVKSYQQAAIRQRLHKEEVRASREIMLLEFQAKCDAICPDEKQLCDILIDLCYASSKSKQFVWDICGGVIISNLLQKNGGIIRYPVRVASGGEFEFGGEQFIMCEKRYYARPGGRS